MRREGGGGEEGEARGGRRGGKADVWHRVRMRGARRFWDGFKMVPYTPLRSNAKQGREWALVKGRGKAVQAGAADDRAGKGGNTLAKYDCAFTRNLRAIRREMGISVEEMSGYLGKAKSTYNNYEAGFYRMSPELREKAARRLGLTVEMLSKEQPQKKVSRLTARPVKSISSRKEAGEGAGKRSCPPLFIQSQMGGSIRLEDVFQRVEEVAPMAECIYVKPEENRAYWTAEKGSGYVTLW